MENIYIPPKTKKKKLRVSHTVYPDKRFSFNDTMQHIHGQLRIKNQ